ncbi:5-formyltetrahydrofolate cyclo-ligase [Agrobacterium sp.]|jgi:5-formyltetrahydrofolate cyclo-ligase|uniref:5-formyltetrahydrofolate cyclo-ligase n=1 Tax=Agrobacterium sp. TaxID=361 RepID=UPI0028A89DC9|nr:5-formyltetrahydrofolate cyclo-ligase [Agrobacterium sp.]
MSGDPLAKARLRGERLAARDALGKDERAEKSLAIAAHGISGLDIKSGSVISGFLPIRSEVDLWPLLIDLAKKDVRICLPVVLDRRTIVFREFHPDIALVDTGFGTRGPGEDAAVLDPDMLLVPLSVFDGQGNRIGYGAGHYDRAIDKLHKKGMNPVLVGVAFACQEVPSVPAEPHDVRLHAVLTENGVRYFE